MKRYHVVFVKNKIVSCNETSEQMTGDGPYYEYQNGQLSFAIVGADNESQARSIAKYLAIELIQRFKQQGVSR